jgi:hypothetical protein
MKKFKQAKRINNIPILSYNQIYGLIQRKIYTLEDLISSYNNSEKRLNLLGTIFIDESSFQNAIFQAELMRVHGINKLTIKLLNLVGIYTLTQLANQEATVLNSKLTEMNNISCIVKINRSDYIIHKWINQAKSLIKSKDFILKAEPKAKESKKVDSNKINQAEILLKKILDTVENTEFFVNSFGDFFQIIDEVKEYFDKKENSSNV